MRLWRTAGRCALSCLFVQSEIVQIGPQLVLAAQTALPLRVRFRHLHAESSEFVQPYRLSKYVRSLCLWRKSRCAFGAQPGAARSAAYLSNQRLSK